MFMGVSGLVEDGALHGGMAEIAEAVIVPTDMGDDPLHFLPVRETHPASNGVGEHFLGKSVGDLFNFVQDNLLVVVNVLEWLTVPGHTAGIDREHLTTPLELVVGAPRADRVEAFESKTRGVNQFVAGAATLVAAVDRQQLTQRTGSGDIGYDGRDGRGWRRRMNAHDVLQHPDTPLNRRGIRAICGDFKNRCHGHDATAWTVLWQVDTVKSLRFWCWDIIMLSEA